MALTVRKMIAQLKKMPQDAVVVWQDHDQSEDEINAYARTVDEAPDAMYLRSDRPRSIVVIRP